MRIVALVVAVGCARSAPEAMVPMEGTPRAVTGWRVTNTSRQVSVPRPELDVEQLVPDFHEELRWPLTAMSHPELSPHFHIANVFAEPGVDWLELCERGVQNRLTAGKNRDELEYLRGWCSATKGDAEAACNKLAPLRTSIVLGMPAAVRIDLANIIANTGDIDKADHLMMKYRIDDLETLDTLAATYVELGMEGDAYEVNRRTLDGVGHTTNAVQCRRLVKDIVLGGKGGLDLRLKQFESFIKKYVPDETCVSLYKEVQCWAGPGTACGDYFRAHGIHPDTVWLLYAYQKWPRQGTWIDWMNVGDAALKAMPLPGAELLVRLAFNAALDAEPLCKADGTDVNGTLTTSLRETSKWFKEPRFVEEMRRCPY